MPGLLGLFDPSQFHLPKVGMGAGGLLALFVAFKVGRFIFKVLFGLVALALLAGAVWWFLNQ